MGERNEQVSKEVFTCNIFFWKKWHWALLTSCWEIRLRKVELPEVGPHAASRAGCEQQSCVPKAWHLHTLHTLSSLLCASCCCQSTCGDVRPPTQPERTAFWIWSPSSHLQQNWHLCSGQLRLCLDDAWKSAKGGNYLASLDCLVHCPQSKPDLSSCLAWSPKLALWPPPLPHLLWLSGDAWLHLCNCPADNIRLLLVHPTD